MRLSRVGVPSAVAGQRLLFLGGLHRSGTSLIHRCITRHPQVSGFSDTGVPEDEGQHLQTVFPPAHAYGGPGRFGFDPRAPLTEDSPLMIAENRDRLLRQRGQHWEMTAAVSGAKPRPNLRRV